MYERLSQIRTDYYLIGQVLVTKHENGRRPFFDAALYSCLLTFKPNHSSGHKGIHASVILGQSFHDSYTYSVLRDKKDYFFCFSTFSHGGI